MRFGLIGQSLLITLAMVVAACSTKPMPAPAPTLPTQAPDGKPAELAVDPSSIATDKPGVLEPEAVAHPKDTEPTNDTL